MLSYTLRTMRIKPSLIYESLNYMLINDGYVACMRGACATGSHVCVICPPGYVQNMGVNGASVTNASPLNKEGNPI